MANEIRISNVITPAILNAAQIDTTTIADNSVTDDKIVNGTILNQSLSDYTIEPTKLALPTPTGDKLLTFNNTTGVVEYSTTYVHADTDTLTEGSTNLYYTDTRADARIGAASIFDVSDVTGTHGAGKILVDTGSAFMAMNVTTDNFVEGSTNLFHTSARAISAVENEATLDLTGQVTVTGNTSTKITTIGDYDALNLYDSTGIQVSADDTSWAGISLVEYVGGASKPLNSFANPFFNTEVWGGAPGSEAECPSGKRLFALSGAGSIDNGGTIQQPTSAPARIIIETTETQTTSGRGAKMYINTTPNGSTTRSTTATFHGDVTTLIELQASGAIIFSNLPTSDPSNPGQLWNDGGTLKVS